MINITRWSPDTCDCIVEYSWDTEVSEDQRVHTPTNVIRKCEEHKDEADSNIHAIVNEENPRKNKLMSRLEQFTELVQSNPGGSVQIRGNLVSWKYNAARILEVTISGLTAQKKAQAQTWANTNLGAGKVIIL